MSYTLFLYEVTSRAVHEKTEGAQRLCFEEM